MEEEPPYWMNSVFTELKNNPMYEDLVEDLHPLEMAHSSASRREMNSQVRAWLNHVRELVFDIEDWVYQKPAVLDMAGQLEITDQVNKFKAQIKQTLELYTRYNLVKQLPADRGGSSRTTRWLAEERSSPLYAFGERNPQRFRVLEERSHLIALEEWISHLKEHLLKRGEMMLKVVSIFGREGSGKTSLAKEIHAKLQRQFECQAFVSVGRRASVRATLLDILRQVKPGTIPLDRNTSQDLHKLRTELWEYLCTKRYFIVLDGLWSKRVWKVINSALPDKNCGSRVLATTCNIHVAEYCSMRSIEDLYAMKPLSEYDSRILLRRSFHIENNRRLDDIYIQELSAKLLEICGGMPLGIIVTAGLLTGLLTGVPDKMDLEYVLGSLERKAFAFLSKKKNPTSDGMTKILNMSYADLCLPLQSCFLYLSVFPEEYTIIKDRLIWLWKVEGFIPDNLFWLTGERYFKELINRGLIQPVFSYDDDEVVGCTIHGVIHDFIRSLSRDENFVTVGADLGSDIFPCSSDRVRRFSLDCCNDRDEANILASSTRHLLSMRSLTVFGDTEERDGDLALTVSDGSPVLPCFKLIRVLDLEDADNLRSHHLIGMEGLILLKYLGLRGTGIDELPGDIGKLEHLEMLDVRQTSMTTLPASIAGLKRLMRLLVDSVVNVPFSIYEMEAMEEVSTIGADSVISFLLRPEHVRTRPRPRRLRVLGLSLAGISRYSSDVLSFFGGCHGLVSISLVNLERTFLRDLSLYGGGARHQKIELTIPGPISSRAIFYITSRVTHLHMEVTQLTEEAVNDLMRLQNLVLLKLVSAGTNVPSVSRKRTRPKRCAINEGAFERLLVVWFRCKAGGTQLRFGRGALPQLRRLGLCFNAWETLSRYGDFEFGIQHLKCLARVDATISCQGATASELENAEAAIRVQAREAGATTIELRRELEDKMLAGERKTMGLLAKMANRLGLPS